jgi:outer membrane biosynthesis protein TonB
MATNKNDNRNKALSALITLLLGAGIVALLLFTSLHYHYPPLDGEKEAQLLQDTIMFGGEFVEMGDFDELLNDEAAQLENAEQQPAESDNTELQQVGQNDLSDNGSFDESPQQQVASPTQPSPMKVQEQPKKLPAEKKTEQPTPKQPQKQGEPKPQPATKKTEQSTPATPSEADKRIGKAFGKSNGSGEGKQGDPNGAQGAEKSVGKPGVGGLEGYTLEYFPTAKCPAPGTVVIRVTVSPTGAVTKATITGGSVTDQTTRNRCLGLARQSRFRVPVGQSIERSGTLTYTIR